MKDALYARIEAFLNEFTFLRRYVKKENVIKRPKVQRIDLDLMDRRSCTNLSQRTASRYGSNRFLIIGVNGEELGETKPDDYLNNFSFWHISTWFSGLTCITGETIHQTIQKLNNPDQVKFILELDNAFNMCGYTTIVLHKVPAGRSFSDWLDQIQKIAQDELQKELAKVDNI